VIIDSKRGEVPYLDVYEMNTRKKTEPERPKKQMNFSESVSFVEEPKRRNGYAVRTLPNLYSVSAGGT
jgi:hypothetical protein